MAKKSFVRKTPKMRTFFVFRSFFFLDKPSLSFERTSAGIVCCFWGMFDTIRLFRKIKSVFTFIPQNPMHLEYKTIFKGNVEKVGNPYVGFFNYV